MNAYKVELLNLLRSHCSMETFTPYAWDLLIEIVNARSSFRDPFGLDQHKNDSVFLSRAWRCISLIKPQKSNVLGIKNPRYHINFCHNSRLAVYIISICSRSSQRCFGFSIVFNTIINF